MKQLSKILQGPVDVNKNMNIHQMAHFLGDTIKVAGEVKSWNMCRAKKLALASGNNAYEKQFSLIPAFVVEFNKANPNSHAWLITDAGASVPQNTKLAGTSCHEIIAKAMSIYYRSKLTSIK